MSLVAFFAASGVVTWGWLIWRLWRVCSESYKRLKWALSGHRRRALRLR
jgi:hypothetical protein